MVKANREVAAWMAFLVLDLPALYKYYQEKSVKKPISPKKKEPGDGFIGTVRKGRKGD